jgi:hypothetical protein
VFETSRFQRSGFEGGARLPCFANFRQPFLIPSCCSGHAPSRFRTGRGAPNSKIILLVRPFLPCNKICRAEAPSEAPRQMEPAAMVGFAGRSGRRTAGVALP